MSQPPFIDMNQSNGIKEMMSKSGYSHRAIQYYIERPHMGTLPNADQVSEMTGSCGDTMEIYLKVNGDKIVNAKYQVMGCAGAISAAMAVVDLIKGRSIIEAKKLVDGDIFRVLEEIPVKKHHCIQLAVKTLHKGLDEYGNNHYPPK
jgi:nitrogen fixation NifU-like protein